MIILCLIYLHVLTLGNILSFKKGLGCVLTTKYITVVFYIMFNIYLVFLQFHVIC